MNDMTVEGKKYINVLKYHDMTPPRSLTTRLKLLPCTWTWYTFCAKYKIRLKSPWFIVHWFCCFVFFPLLFFVFCFFPIIQHEIKFNLTHTRTNEIEKKKKKEHASRKEKNLRAITALKWRNGNTVSIKCFACNNQLSCVKVWPRTWKNICFNQ